MRNIAIAIILLTASSLSQTTFGLDILDNVTSQTVAQPGGAAINSNVWQGYAFLVGSTGYTLNQVQFIPTTIGSSPITNKNIDISVYQLGSSATLPANSATPTYTQTMSGITFIANSGATSADLLTFTPSTTWSLAANTRYAVVFSNGTAGTGTGVASSVASTAPAVAGGLTYLNTALTTNGGASWFSNSNTYYVKFVSTSVPEPSTYALAAIATGVLGFAARKRRRTAKI